MSRKAISIVIDDFSSRLDELDGVFVYDYGVVDSYIIRDFYFQDGSGKGDFEGEFDQILFQGSEYKYEIFEDKQYFDHLDIYKCDNCDFSFAHPMPKSKNLDFFTAEV